MTQAIRESRVTRVSCMSLETVMVVTQAIRESRVTRVSSMSLETGGCDPGYQGITCNQGKLHVTGDCNGCDPGYQGITCNQGKFHVTGDWWL